MRAGDSDAYGHEVWDYFVGRLGNEVIERDDGLVDPSAEAPAMYFAPLKDWPAVERKGVAFMKGRVLDVGCGAGRVGIYLQRRQGFDVTGIDTSPLALKVARARGLRKARLLAFGDIGFPPRSFDSVVMYGNNFGLFGSRARARRLLKRLHRMTTAEATIVCSSVDPYKSDDPVHIKYQEQNRAKGRMSGQVRIRARYRTYVGKWFDYLLVSPKEMRELSEGTGWRVDRLFVSKGGPLYVAVMRKEARSRAVVSKHPNPG
ncbi:MAG: class I SAM-dependent methyltransferase [Nitrososphaerota archaeon]|nr:class I SAM-dependent methyltransferase [Nitrososphaerota archaeon]